MSTVSGVNRGHKRTGQLLLLENISYCGKKAIRPGKLELQYSRLRNARVIAHIVVKQPIKNIWVRDDD